MIPGKLMLTRPSILLLCLLGHYSALTVGHNITIPGAFFAANEPVSVLAANPTATTFVGTRTLTITFSGLSTTGTQTGTVTETFVLGPSTAAYTEVLTGLSATDACVLTRSLTQGNCFFASTALNTDHSTSIQTTVFETYTLAPADFSFQLSYTVTAGQEKLFNITATTTSCAPSTSSGLSTSSALSTSSTPSVSSTPSISSTPSANSAFSTSSVLSTSSAPSASFPTSIIPPFTSNSTSNSSAISATNLAPTTALTSSPTIPITNSTAIRYDFRYLNRAVVGFATTIVVAMFLYI